MKITIELTEAEERGLRDYLKDSDLVGNKEDIKVHVQNIVSGVINAPQEASSSYIEKYLK
jgi:hypothetical protein